jgi:zinc/manganese transport system substrate-binding protein
MKKLLLALVALMAFASPVAARPLRVVTTFSLLADMTRRLGGDEVEVRSLVGPNGDVHAYQPTPDDVRAVAEADLLIVNGLGLEAGMRGLIGAPGINAQLLVASAGVKPRMMTEEQGEIVDPHAWQDLANGWLYIRNIAAGLEKLTPTEADAIKVRAKAYSAACVELDVKLRARFAAVPVAKRKIITSHDAFGYFGAAYGVTFLSPLGLNPDAEPSAQNVAALIKQIRAEGVKAVFIENMTDPRLVKQIAKESGAKLDGVLYPDALSGEDGDAPTYLDMVKTNAEKMLRAME